MVSVKHFKGRRVKLIGIVWSKNNGKRVCLKTPASLLKHQKTVCVHASKNNRSALNEHGACRKRCDKHVTQWRKCAFARTE
tara:strand:+ start:314 stop:556 length:243 start_codon:yes stop_codon:yes gene_type:complete